MNNGLCGNLAPTQKTVDVALLTDTCGNEGGRVTRMAVDRPSGNQRGISKSDLYNPIPISRFVYKCKRQQSHK